MYGHLTWKKTQLFGIGLEIVAVEQHFYVSIWLQCLFKSKIEKLELMMHSNLMAYSCLPKKSL